MAMILDKIIKKINKIVQLNSYFYHVLSRFVNYCSVCYELC